MYKCIWPAFHHLGQEGAPSRLVINLKTPQSQLTSLFKKMLEMLLTPGTLVGQRFFLLTFLVTCHHTSGETFLLLQDRFYYLFISSSVHRGVVILENKFDYHSLTTKKPVDQTWGLCSNSRRNMNKTLAGQTCKEIRLRLLTDREGRPTPWPQVSSYTIRNRKHGAKEDKERRQMVLIVYTLLHSYSPLFLLRLYLFFPTTSSSLSLCLSPSLLWSQTHQQ